MQTAEWRTLPLEDGLDGIELDDDEGVRCDVVVGVGVDNGVVEDLNGMASWRASVSVIVGEPRVSH